MSTVTDRDEFDEMLNASAPFAPEPSAALRAEAVSMIVAAEHGVGRRRTGRRRLSRAAVAGITAGSLLGFGGVAATAATFEQWAPWAQESDAVLTYTLPSGAECELRIGQYAGGEPEASQAAREWAASVDLLAVADIDGSLQSLREGDFVAVQDDGTEIVGGYGTDHYFTPDAEYDQAVTQAVGWAIDAELVRQGFETGAADINLVGAATCPGAQW